MLHIRVTCEPTTYSNAFIVRKMKQISVVTDKRNQTQYGHFTLTRSAEHFVVRFVEDT